MCWRAHGGHKRRTIGLLIRLLEPMSPRLRERLAQFRVLVAGDDAPRLSDESRWYTEHTALLISTLKWAFLGAGAGICVGLGTRGFLWALAHSATWRRSLPTGRCSGVLAAAARTAGLRLAHSDVRPRRPRARHRGGHRGRASAIRARSTGWSRRSSSRPRSSTLAFGGSVGKEGPAAQIGAALTSLFADMFRLIDDDRRRAWSSAASAPASPRSLARRCRAPCSASKCCTSGGIDYSVIFPALVAGIVGHLACGVHPPFPALQEALRGPRRRCGSSSSPLWRARSSA